MLELQEAILQELHPKGAAGAVLGVHRRGRGGGAHGRTDPIGGGVKKTGGSCRSRSGGAGLRELVAADGAVRHDIVISPQT